MTNNNLALGKEVIIRNALNETANCITAELTNGKRAGLSEDSSWTWLQCGVTEISVDLGSAFSVCGFSVDFLHDVLNFNISPETVKLLLSENGTEFYEVLKVNAPYPASFKVETKANYSSELSEPCLARFAKIRFCCETVAKCADLRIFGSEANGSELKLSGAVFRDVSKNRFASPDALRDKNVALLSFGRISESGEVQRLGRDDFRPIVSFVDRKGIVKDEMFKSVALCQSVLGECPSGGCMTYYSEKPSRLSDWEFLIDELFTEESNLKALNEVFGSVKTQLGQDREARLGVYLTVPVPKISFETFGDLNGDGVEEKLLTTEDCISAFNWYVDAVTRRFNAECLTNLKIEGFIWNNNRIIRELRDDETYFVKECVKGLHYRGYKCVFIGIQIASGVEKSEKVGFDCSTLTIGEDSIASVCKKFGLGINIVSPSSVSDREDLACFVKQLSDCHSFGMLETVHTFQDANTFSSCAYSDNETERLVYDCLYEFINQEEEKIDDEITSCAETTACETQPCEENTEELVEAITEEVVENMEEESETLEEAEKVSKPEEAASAPKNEACCQKDDTVPYEVPTLRLEISVPKSEPDCPDRKCGYCSKYFPQNVCSAQTVEEKTEEPIVENKIKQEIEQPKEETLEVELDAPNDEIEEILFEEIPFPSETKVKKALPESLKKPDKKTAFAAAGLAVALGTAYLIAKSLKGNKNG